MQISRLQRQQLAQYPHKYFEAASSWFTVTSGLWQASLGRSADRIREETAFPKLFNQKWFTGR